MTEVTGTRRGAARVRGAAPRWRKLPVHGATLYRLAPRPRRVRQPVVEFWDRVRAVFRSSLAWGALAAWAAYVDRDGVAITAAIVGLVFLVFAPVDRPVQSVLDYPLETTSPEFLATLSGSTGEPFWQGNRIALFNDGCEFYPEMLDAVASARQSVTMEQYIFGNDAVGRRFAQAFAERARAGIAVKLLVDAMGSSTLGNDILDVLQEGGVQLAWYRPIRWYSLNRANHRTHRKSLIIDGRVGFTGGSGLAQHWDGRADRPECWRDIMVRVEGPAVVPLQTGFAHGWLQSTGELLGGGRFFPEIAPVGTVSVQTVQSSPTDGSSNALVLYTLALLCATRYIYIANPYFVPNPSVMAQLADACARGVDVNVMVAGLHNDNWMARRNAVRLYGKLLEAGVQIFEFGPTMLHQKTMVVDDVWATIGTTNFDNRSFALNDETNLCFHDAAVVTRMREVFQKDLACCEKVELAAWKRRGPFARGGELLAALFRDQV